MSSFKQIMYHIVFCTKYRKGTLALEHSEVLYRYIWGIVKQKNCVLYRINGMEDHIHILSDLHPSVALSDYIRDIKRSSSQWLRDSELFPHFEGWSEGYAAITYLQRESDTILNYIKNQREHHKRISFLDEYKETLRESGIDFDERFLP